MPGSAPTVLPLGVPVRWGVVTPVDTQSGTGWKSTTVGAGTRTTRSPWATTAGKASGGGVILPQTHWVSNGGYPCALPIAASAWPSGSKCQLDAQPWEQSLADTG